MRERDRSRRRQEARDRIKPFLSEQSLGEPPLLFGRDVSREWNGGGGIVLDVHVSVSSKPLFGSFMITEAVLSLAFVFEKDSKPLVKVAKKTKNAEGGESAAAQCVQWYTDSH